MIQPYNLIQPNIDEFGILASRDKGDSPLDLADALFCSHILNMLGEVSEASHTKMLMYFRDCMDQMIILADPTDRFYGMARRHPDARHWYGQYNRMSRDQMHWMIALALADETAFRAFIHNWSRRAFLFGTNTQGNSDFDNKIKLPDFTGPGLWAYSIRCIAISKGAPVPKWLKPVLTLMDLEMLANSLIRVYWYGKDRNETDSRNHLKAMGLAKLVGDTWMAKLARRIYQNMPVKFPDRPGSGPQQEIDDYFNSNGGVSGLAILWAPVVKWILD